jgi:hypothetical protein
MKALMIFLVLTFIGATSGRGQVPENDRSIVVSTRLTVTATIVAASGKIGTPIVVKLVSKNLSSKVVEVADAIPELDYELVVIDSSGKKLPPTAFLDRMLHTNYNYGAHSPRHEMKPRQEIRSEIEVTRLYQVNRPGVYYMWAMREPFDDQGRPPFEESKRPIERAFSNPIQFIISP